MRTECAAPKKVLTWILIDDGRIADGSWPAVLTRTYRAEVPGGALYRTETVWPGGEPTESMTFVPEQKSKGPKWRAVKNGFVEIDE